MRKINKFIRPAFLLLLFVSIFIALFYFEENSLIIFLLIYCTWSLFELGVTLFLRYQFKIGNIALVKKKSSLVNHVLSVSILALSLIFVLYVLLFTDFNSFVKMLLCFLFITSVIAEFLGYSKASYFIFDRKGLIPNNNFDFDYNWKEFDNFKFSDNSVSFKCYNKHYDLFIDEKNKQRLLEFLNS